MLPSSLLHDSNSVIVIDASTAISITECEYATRIVSAISNRITVSDVVVSELESGRHKGHINAELLQCLIQEGLVEVITMGAVATTHFEELVIGSAPDILGDGEAATIACALEIGGVPLIDERKACRVCSERYPSLFYGCTVDIFAHLEVRKALGDADLSLAVLNALKQARMRVQPHYLDWVVNLVGHKNAAECNSLPYSTRKQARAALKQRI